MPLYEFECRRCGGRFEEILSPAELAQELPRCPGCGAPDVARALSTFATGGGGGTTGGGCGGGGGGFT